MAATSRSLFLAGVLLWDGLADPVLGISHFSSGPPLVVVKYPRLCPFVSPVRVMTSSLILSLELDLLDYNTIPYAFVLEQWFEVIKIKLKKRELSNSV